jgi:hypothetical protein
MRARSGPLAVRSRRSHKCASRTPESRDLTMVCVPDRFNAAAHVPSACTRRWSSAVCSSRLIRAPRAAAHAVARQSRRDWRLDTPTKRLNIDTLVLLAMALDRAERAPEPVRFLGFV